MTFNKFKEKTIGVISLGCDKNRVDTEKALAILGSDKLTSDPSEAQVLIVNTCAFLESSRKEAIEAALDANRMRTEGKLEKLILTGCLPQKFIGEIFDEFTEIDAFLGTEDYEFLPEAIERAYNGERVNFVGKGKGTKIRERVVTTPPHYAYLRIADGCDNHCTYCLIPSIRGKYRSESIEDLLEEASKLGEISELILVAQDITRYGDDIYGEGKLVELLRRLTALDNVSSVRLLYCYPDKTTDELIEEIKNNDKIIKYVDIPLQHASNSVLKRMNRKGSKEGYLALIEKLRREIPSIAVRSTFIAGFPGETKEEFSELLDFIKKARLTNAGFFAYSREEGTPAYKMKGQIDEKIKEKRTKKLYAAQRKISRARNKSLVGTTLKVLCDGVDYDKQSFYGRAYFSAPDIDGKIFFTSKGDINQGEYYLVRVKKADDYDLYGEVTDEFTE